MKTNAVVGGFGKLVALTAVALGSVGCASTVEDAKFVESRFVRDADAVETPRVEVLLDRQPERPFVVTRTLTMKRSSNPESIEAMRDAAAFQGLDGIYWIDCTSPCSGMCTAKGFKYEERNVASR